MRSNDARQLLQHAGTNPPAPEIEENGPENRQSAPWLGTGRPGPERPPGSPNRRNRATPQAVRRVERFLSSRHYWDGLKARVIAGKAPLMEQLLWHYAYGRPAQAVKIKDESAPRRVATLVFLDGGRRDPMAGPAPASPPIDVTPKTVRPSVALPEVPFEMDNLEPPTP